MKRLKDPIYGYVEIEDNIIKNIIDTATFQRLRSIIQTSYAPLYASAVHNRFVHSLGVYHLGKLLRQAFEKSAKEIGALNKDEISVYTNIFEHACLLHDVGHAPFSHTGEEFYLDENASREELHKQIIELTGDKLLEEEIKRKNYEAAPHELMSVVVSLKTFSFLFNEDNSEEKSFFARCILGYSYLNEMNVKKSFLNCMISMLNSSVIDVDKLDYLIRDAYITGFDTVSIDYLRLLKSVKILRADSTCKLVFTKAAISVIENVVFAHDAERKWIQSHPVVLYDAYLLRHSIEVLDSKFKVFDYESLTVTGKDLKEGWRISLLTDGDIIFLMKNITDDKLIAEYFSRKDRRHPLWKSEAEYKAIFNRGFNDQIFSTVENEFDELVRYLNFTNKSPEINDTALKEMENDIVKTEKKLRESGASEKHIQKNLATKKKHLKWLKCLKEFATSQKIEFDFLLIKANQFNSGFGKLAFENIEIEFPGLKDPCNFKKVTNALSATKSERDKFYYLFVRRDGDKDLVDVSDLATRLGKLAMEEAFQR